MSENTEQPEASVYDRPLCDAFNGERRCAYELGHIGEHATYEFNRWIFWESGTQQPEATQPEQGERRQWEIRRTGGGLFGRDKRWVDWHVTTDLGVLGPRFFVMDERTAVALKAYLETQQAKLREVTARANALSEASSIAEHERLAAEAKLQSQEQELAEADSRFVEMADRLNGLLSAQEQELTRLRGLVVRADSMLSFIRHRGRVHWNNLPSFALDTDEVDELIGELRKQALRAEEGPPPS